MQIPNFDQLTTREQYEAMMQRGEDCRGCHRQFMPFGFTLGSYDAQTRSGPTIWLKCIVGRTLQEAPPPEVTPILYLPGVSRQELRAGGDCRPAYQPLVELLFRGRAWHQENGKDWSVEAFLVADEGLALDVARDLLTRDAIARALPVLAATTPLTDRCSRFFIRAYSAPRGLNDPVGSSVSSLR